MLKVENIDYFSQQVQDPKKQCFYWDLLHPHSNGPKNNKTPPLFFLTEYLVMGKWILGNFPHTNTALCFRCCENDLKFMGRKEIPVLYGLDDRALDTVRLGSDLWIEGVVQSEQLYTV